MTEQHRDLTPLPVTHPGLDALARHPAATPQKKKHKHITYRTIVLSATNPVRPLLAPDPSRDYVQIIVQGNPVVLCESESKAQDPANQAAGLPNPEGMLLPVNPGPIRLHLTDLTWVTAQAFPAIVSIAIVSDAEA
jgi:hypothetical protein